MQRLHPLTKGFGLLLLVASLLVTLLTIILLGMGHVPEAIDFAKGGFGGVGATLMVGGFFVIMLEMAD